MGWRRWLKIGLFLLVIDGAILLAVEAGLGWRAPPYHRQVARSLKPTDRPRVFVFGESTIYGFPYGPESSTARWLEAILQRVLPEAGVEVVNFGRPARSSHHLEQAVRETVKLKPAAVILCLGHNEFLARSLALTEGPRHRWCYFHLNTYRCGFDLLADWRSRQEQTAQADLGPGIAPDGPLAQRVREQFLVNLEHMIAHCQSAGVPVLLAIPAANLAWPPMYSPPDPSLSPTDQQRLAALLAGATAVRRAGQDPMPLIAKAARLSPRHPAVAHALGWQARAAGDPAEAERHFTQARDADRLPFRCQGPFQEAMRTAAARAGVPCVDLPERFREAAGGPPGMEWFMDNCHPRPWGQYLMAEAMADGLRQAGWLAPADAWCWEHRPGWNEVAAKLGGDWQRCERAAIHRLLLEHPELALEMAERPPAGVAETDAEWRTYRLLARFAAGREGEWTQWVAESDGWPVLSAEQTSTWPTAVRELYGKAQDAASATGPRRASGTHPPTTGHE